MVVAETDKDDELGSVKRNLLTQATDSPYTLNHGILFKNERIVIPKSLQEQILQKLHSTHIGITKMKQLARRYVYWKRIDKDIENLVKSCKSCALLHSNPSKAPLHPWDEPTSNWERIHIDYATYANNNFLVCIDAKSKWLEIKALNSAPTAINTIQLLDNIFFSHGYPQVLVSDNATIFTSSEFKLYCKVNGIFQKFIAPGHAATNGLAERTVQTLKLLCGQSPAELYLNRKLCIKLDALRPYKPSRLTLKRHVDQLRSTQVKQVRFSPDTKPASRHPSIENVPRLNIAIQPDPQPDPQLELQPDPLPQDQRHNPVLFDGQIGCANHPNI
ncbi:uncharacterized protein K02A2.6-like [Temnothorax curvispinosus]|uniref:RNA-directed DNA polymerase n=1 Tax=Temnothorax curvispinosus TaxID=300111 RepID=A0A6J1PHM2_9HYME|nr:uncharacterized protein K02A2.6-like [Temnothorax curvispinosus]